jgi:hypothetical protein
MSDIVSMIVGQLSGGQLSKISSQIGADDSTTKNAIGAALPMLVTAMARNASTSDGASALHKAVEKDHDGGLLDNLSGFLSNPAVAGGAGILKHVLGGKQKPVESGIAKGTGLSSGQTGQLLAILAPIVMAALGKQQRSSGLDAGGLAGMLAGQRAAAEKQSGGLLGGLTSMLDSDGDGSAIDDLGSLAGKFFGK